MAALRAGVLTLGSGCGVKLHAAKFTNNNGNKRRIVAILKKHDNNKAITMPIYNFNGCSV